MAQGRKRIGPGGAALASWLVLALVNQVLIGASGVPSPLGTSALHRAYDAGQLVFAGIASLTGVELGRLAAVRWPRFARSRFAEAAALALVVFGVSLSTVENDVTNTAGRYGVPVALMMVGASGVFALALGATVFVRALSARWMRLAIAAVGVGLGVANAFVLSNDYPAAHLVLAWLAALLLGHGIEGALPAATNASVRRVSLVVLSAVGIAALAIPPPQAVRRRLFDLPSAVVAPFAARLWPERDAAALARVPDAIVRSPWFQSRKRLPAVPPTGALVLPERPLVLFLTIDAVRAEVLEVPKYRRKLRALSALQEQGAYFRMARAPASSTRPSMAAVFTGRYANQLRWSKRDGETYLSDAGPRLAELLSVAGVATVSLPLLKRIGAESGVGKGFQKQIRQPFAAKELVDRIIELTTGASGPTFLYAHFGEPHAPYRGKGPPKQRYVREVAEVDRELQRLLRHLDTSGLAERTLLVVSADHGEAFGEHGVNNHATIVYEEVARIPLLVRGPGVVARRIDEPVTLLDITPTLLDVFGLPAPGPFMGQSLAPLLAGRAAELERPIAIVSAGPLDALYVPGSSMKVIFDSSRRTVEVYDLSRDPEERRNLVDASEPEVDRAIEIAKLFFDAHAWRRRERIED